jgi:plastocyanin
MGRWIAALGVIAGTLLPGGAALADEDGYGATVPMLDNVFRTEVVRVQPGATTEWVNEGRATHDVVADDGSWGSGILDPGASFDHTFDEPGLYRYHCSLHGAPGVGMTGLVAVGDVPLPGPTADVGPGPEPVPGGFAETVRVPADRPTIQEAVDHARPGGMVLIAPGVYRESVTVTVPFLTIRGEDRNRTIVDGGFERANGFQVFEADGVTIENITARNHLLNGFFWSGVLGYRGSYLTAENNGDYGIYAFASRYGQFDHSYASGSPDSGFYVGGCSPCDALIIDVEAEHNLLGFSGTNAGGNLAIVNSEWHDNAAGIVPNTLDSEPEAPQADAVIAGNHVHDNNYEDAPMKSTEWAPAFGNGIIVAGGRADRIVGNLVEDQETYGIVLIPMPDESFWPTADNRVAGNVVRRSGVADLAIAGPTEGGDCFEDNDADATTPGAIEALFPCTGFRPNPAGGGAMAPWAVLAPRLLTDVPLPDYRGQPPAPEQDQMPGDPAAAPPAPAVPGETVPEPYTIRAVSQIPSAPGPEVSKEPTVLGMPIATSWWNLLLGLYAYLLPFVLYASWVAVAMWDLIRQESEAIARRSRWMLVVLIVPFLGPLLYFGFGRSPIPRPLRLMLTVGGAAVYLAFVALGTIVS